MHKFQLALLLGLTFCLSQPNCLRAQAPGTRTSPVISMTASHWHPVSDKPDVQYVMKEGFPDGIIVLKSGDLALNGLCWRNIFAEPLEYG
ncbi:hypothetical protein HDF11_005295 [Tunturiibacter psychrotolerans]